MPEVDGVSHRWVEARGLRFHVAEAGEGDDVVLCLHGWPQNWYEWRHLMPALAAGGHRVLAMDLRGYGWSDAPRDSDGYLKENMADDVLAVLDELGLQRVKLVAHDWGGWIGFLLGMKAPERFDRYLALNILHPWIKRPDDAAPPLALLVPVGDPHAGPRLPPPPRRQVRPQSHRRRLDPEGRLGRADPERLRRQPGRARPRDGRGADLPRLQPQGDPADHPRQVRPQPPHRADPPRSSAKTTSPCAPRSWPATRSTPTTCRWSSSPTAATSSPTSAPSWSPSGRGSSSPLRCPPERGPSLIRGPARLCEARREGHPSRREYVRAEQGGGTPVLRALGGR